VRSFCVALNFIIISINKYT